MKKSSYGNNDRPDIEFNNTTKQLFCQNPQLNLILYLPFIFASFRFWQQLQETKRMEILMRCRPALDVLTAELENRETLSGDDVTRIAAGCDDENSFE